MHSQIILAAVSLLFLVSVAEASLYEDYDRFKDIHVQETGNWGGFRGENELDDGRYLSLTPAKTTYHDKTYKYTLRLRWTGRELLVFERATLILLIDGERFSLEPSSTFTDYLVDHRLSTLSNSLSEQDINERLEYEVPETLITKIANAKSVECALYTPKGRIERTFSKGNKSQFKEFVEKVINP